MYAARIDDPIAHTSALTGLVGGAVAGALLGAGFLLVAGTGGLAAPIVLGAVLAGAGVGAWVGEYVGSLSFLSNLNGKLSTGSRNVFINGKPVCRAGVDESLCDRDGGPPQRIATGSATVFINGRPAARVDDKLTCDAFIREGSPNVRIGGGKQQILEIEPEVPWWAHASVMAAGIGGAILLGGVAVLPAVAGALALGYAGGVGGGLIGRLSGDWLSQHLGGLPSDWEKTGTFAGQAGGGYAGAKGGARAWDALSTKPTAAPEPPLAAYRRQYGVIEKEILVEAVGEVNGKTYYDTNQMARNPQRADASEKLPIYDQVAKKEAKSLAKGNDPFPNKTMADAHAEIAVIQQAIKAGETKGAEIKIKVTGKFVCGYCKSDLKAMAKAAELKSLTVEDTVKQELLIWRQGQTNWEVTPIGDNK